MSEKTVRILPDFQGYSEGKVCFRTGAEPEDVYNMQKWAFEHKGPKYDFWAPSSIRLLRERVLLGQDIPSEMIVTQPGTTETAAAALIFEEPSLLLNGDFNGFLQSVDVLSRLGSGFAAHIPYQHRILVRGFNRLASDAEQPLEKGIRFLINFFRSGKLPDIPPPPNPKVIEDNRPFVVFRGPPACWQKIWSEGYTCGIRFGEEYTEVLKKSNLVEHLDLGDTAKQLNEREGEEIWAVEGTVVAPLRGTTNLTEEEVTQIVNVERK